MSGNVGLAASLKFAGLSKSKGYQYGLIPVYDDAGNRIYQGKVAPFPWLPMPDDVPPVLSSTAVWSPIPRPKEIGREEALFRRTDHRLPA